MIKKNSQKDTRTKGQRQKDKRNTGQMDNTGQKDERSKERKG